MPTPAPAGLGRRPDDLRRRHGQLRDLVLAIRHGDLDQAQAHVDRMLELVERDWVGWPLDRPIVELQLARGDPRSALATLRERYERVAWRDQQGDLHAALGACAAGDLAQEARDRQDAAAEAEARDALDEMLAYGAELARDPRAHIDDPVSHRSWGARLGAETARCRPRPRRARRLGSGHARQPECGFTVGRGALWLAVRPGAAAG